MSTFGGRIHELENILVDNFLSHKSHTCFFLSHCHSDHMSGLDQLFLALDETSNRYLYCSPITRLILFNKYNNIASKNVIKELTSPTVITVPENAAAPSYQVTVTPLPAGHCPGSVMFLFEAVNTTILHTGDFRILKDDISKFKCLYSKNTVKSIDKVYLDCTFLNDVFWEFPSRSAVVTELTNIAMNWMKKSPQHKLLLETCATFGYEYVFVELARKLNCKIHVKDFLCDLFWNVPEIGSFLTKDCRSTRIHAVGIFDKKCVPLDREKLLRIKLSAQWYKSEKVNIGDKIWKQVGERRILMCYSTHCSCSELINFLSHLQPRSVEPCCDAVGSSEEGTKSYIRQVMSSWSSQRRKSPEPVESGFPLERNYKFKLRFPERGENDDEEATYFSPEKRNKLSGDVETDG